MTKKFRKGPLTLSAAPAACEQALKSIPDYPESFGGRGIVICEGVEYFTNVWVGVCLIRSFGCELPIQVWHLEPWEIDTAMRSILASKGVECVNAGRMLRRFPSRRAWGWDLKPYAILHCPFQEVIYLNAYNSPVGNPEKILKTPQYLAEGAIFWPGWERLPKATQPVWDSCGLRRPNEPEFDSSQMVFDKRRCWRALRFWLWLNENSDFYCRHLPGARGTLQLAFRKLRKSYVLIDTPIRSLEGAICQHGFDGRRAFQNRCAASWNLVHNRRIPGFLLEDKCRRYVDNLRQLWDGRMSKVKGLPRERVLKRKTPVIRAVMISCQERGARRRQTLRNLAGTDWGGEPVHVVIDQHESQDPKERQTATALSALRWGLDSDAEYLLFLEDDLSFNRHIRHNLNHWNPLRNRTITLAGLYNPHLGESACDPANQALILNPNRIFGSQAFLISKPTIDCIVRNWDRVQGMQDIRISRLAGLLKRPIVYHCPSLVQHVGTKSVWGGWYHYASDYERHWKAP